MPQDPKILAAEIEAMLNTTAWQYIDELFGNEVRAAEVLVMETGKSRDGINPSKLALDLRYFQGLLDGIMKSADFPLQLLDELRKGRVPKATYVGYRKWRKR